MRCYENRTNLSSRVSPNCYVGLRLTRDHLRCSVPGFHVELDKCPIPGDEPPETHNPGVWCAMARTWPQVLPIRQAGTSCNLRLTHVEGCRCAKRKRAKTIPLPKRRMIRHNRVNERMSTSGNDTDTTLAPRGLADEQWCRFSEEQKSLSSIPHRCSPSKRRSPPLCICSTCRSCH